MSLVPVAWKLSKISPKPCNYFTNSFKKYLIIVKNFQTLQYFLNKYVEWIIFFKYQNRICMKYFLCYTIYNLILVQISAQCRVHLIDKLLDVVGLCSNAFLYFIWVNSAKFIYVLNSKVLKNLWILNGV